MDGGAGTFNYRQVSFRQLDLNDETYVVNQMKEDVCFVSQNYTADAITTAKPPTQNELLLEYMLPDFESTVRGSVRPREDMLRHIAMAGDGQSVRHVKVWKTHISHAVVCAALSPCLRGVAGWHCYAT